MKYLVLAVALVFYLESHASDNCIDSCNIDTASLEPLLLEPSLSKPSIPPPQNQINEKLANEFNLSIQLDDGFNELNPQVWFQLYQDQLLLDDKSIWLEFATYINSQSDSIYIKTTAVDSVDQGQLLFGKFELSIDPATELSGTNRTSKRFVMSMPVITRFTDQTNIVLSLGSVLHLPTIIRPGTGSFTPTGNAIVTLLAESTEKVEDHENERHILLNDTVNPGENKIFHLADFAIDGLEIDSQVKFTLIIDLQLTAESGSYNNVAGDNAVSQPHASVEETDVVNEDYKSGGGILSPLLLLLFVLVRVSYKRQRSALM